MSISSISSGGGFQAYALLATRAAVEQPSEAAPGTKALTAAEERTVEKLQARDAEVRRHEQAHLAAAGPYGKGAPQYEYQEAPDGKRYAIGGHVKIDSSAVPGDPEATIRKAQVVKRAALAPQEPSAQDRKIAQKADRMVQQARRELQAQKAEEADEQAAAQGLAPAGTADEALASPSSPPQGYDRQGVGVFGAATPAHVNLTA